MIRFSRYRCGAAMVALALGFSTAGLIAGHAEPASAEVQVSVSFGYFEDRLAHHGGWMHHPRWGDVWRPVHARGFRPYYDGYWEYTDDYGWMWVSDEPWADITYHYGRWVYDPDEGWLWIPGYVWGPAWVIWREGEGHIGWFPMPPDYGDFGDGPYYGGRYGWDDCYGYRTWYRMDNDSFFNLWIFVDHGHFTRRDFHSFVVRHDRARDIIRHSSDSTRYAMRGDRIVNHSVPIERIERATHRRIEAVPARRFLHESVPVTRASVGRDIARREHGRDRDRDGRRGFEERSSDHGAPPHVERKPPDSGPFGDERRERSGHDQDRRPDNDRAFDARSHDLGPPPREERKPREDHSSGDDKPDRGSHGQGGGPDWRERRSQDQPDQGGPPREHKERFSERDRPRSNDGPPQDENRGRSDRGEGGSDSGGQDHGHRGHGGGKDR